MSLVAVTDAEWRTRKINLMEVFRSFISQLRPGQELTKVSLPSVLCHPFSMLEVIAHRKLNSFHELFNITHEEDPLKRFLIAVQYYFTIPRSETYEKKPFNPVIGETHFCWIKNGKDDYTEFISEQVSHHPPVSAYYVNNRLRNIKMWGNLIFRVSFGTNYASVTTAGLGRIQVNNEEYHISKCIPDMVIRNVVWGKKYIMWIGKLSIECPETGYFAEIELSEKNKVNVFSGFVKHRDSDDIIYYFNGTCGDVLYYYPPGEEDDERVLIDMNASDDRKVYYQKESDLSELSSLRVWRLVNEAIINNDMKAADTEKKIIEEEQRRRIATKKETNSMNMAQYFEQNPDDQNWHLKENLNFNFVTEDSDD